MKFKHFRVIMALILLAASLVILYFSFRSMPTQTDSIALPTIEAPWVEPTS